MIEDVIVPFGRYRGQPVAAVPVEYLLWVLGRPGMRARYPAFYRAAARLAVSFLKSRLSEDAPLIRPHGKTQRFAVFTADEVLAMRPGRGAS